MSFHAVSGVTAYSYKTLLNTTSSAVPYMNTSVITSHHNVTPRQPAYNVSPATQKNISPEVPGWSLTSVVPQNTDSSFTFFREFQKSKTKALGIVLIVAAILEIALGIGLAFNMFTFFLISGSSFLGSVLYIIAGSLTIAAQAKHNLCLVKGSRSLNIISSIVSFTSLILNCTDLAKKLYCYYYDYDDRDNHYYDRCQEELVTVYVLLSLLLVINLLVFCVSISVSIFECRSLSHVPTTVTQVFARQRDSATSMSPSTVQATSPLLPSTMPTV